MITHRSLVSAFVLVVLQSAAVWAANPTPGQLVRVTTKQGKVSGEVIESTGITLTILNLKNDREEKYRQEEILDVLVNPTDQELLQNLTPAQVFAYRTTKAVLTEGKSGHVAELDGASVYINLGTSQGVKNGDVYLVSRGSDPIKDPVTGEVIGVRQKRLGRLEVIETEPKVSKTKLLGDLETPLQVGDAVKPEAKSKAIAILPLVSDDGSISKGSLALADELATRLANAGFTVVERSQLLRVFGELGLQQSTLFDEKTSQSLGKQTGASAVLLGRALKSKAETTLSVRVVDTGTGTVGFACTVKPTTYDHEQAIKNVFRRGAGGAVNVPVGDIPAETESKGQKLAKADAKDFQEKYPRNPGAYDATIVRKFKTAQSVNGGGGERGDTFTTNAGKWECRGGNRWEESGKGFKNDFVEVDRNDKYVELARATNRQETRYVLARIYDDCIWIKQVEDLTFRQYYTGSWTKHGSK